MEIYGFIDYKKFVLSLLKEGPKKGRGGLKKMAEHLRVNSVVMSQIFNGDRDLNLEQTYELCEYFGFTELEKKYFVLMVELARAGSHKLQNFFKAQLEEIKSQSQEIKSRVKVDKTLDENSKATFYSNWFYTGISLLTAIDGFQDTETIANHLNLPRATVKKVFDFLIENGINVMEKDEIKPGPRITHLEANSPLVSRHHTNWRLKGFEHMMDVKPDDLFYTGPMVLSESLQKEVRKNLVSLIEKNLKTIEGCPDEVLCCLNIDWFKI